MKTTVEIKYAGIPLLIEGTYHQAMRSLDYFDPPEPAEFDIDKIYIADSQIDVSNLFENDWESILDLIFEEIEG